MKIQSMLAHAVINTACITNYYILSGLGYRMRINAHDIRLACDL